jgi:hypothetical protein
MLKGRAMPIEMPDGTVRDGRGDSDGKALALGDAGCRGFVHPVTLSERWKASPLAASPEKDPTAAREASAGRALLVVDRHWLFAIAGVIWTGVGVLLLTYAVTWIAPVAVPLEIALAVGGLAVAALFVRFVFGGIVRKNIERIDQGPARVSAFAFQGWKSYLVTVFMIGLGITLRHSSLPKPGLAVVYEGIGVALLLTSLLYHRRLVNSLRCATA